MGTPTNKPELHSHSAASLDIPEQALLEYAPQLDSPDLDSPDLDSPDLDSLDLESQFGSSPVLKSR